MELKIPPKKCIEILDELIKEGYLLLDSINKDFWSTYEKKEKKEKKLEKQKNKNPLTSMIRIPFAKNVSEKEIDELRERIEEWAQKTQNKLKSIFVHESPIYYFMNARYDETQVHRTSDGYYTDRSEADRLELKMTTRIEILLDWYNTFSKHSISPFFYEADKCKLWFYDLICPLKADTYMSDLCRFMFSKGIGEKIEHSDIYEYLTGDTNEKNKWPKNWQTKIDNTYREINKKTKKSFGFNIISKEGFTLSIQLPPQLLKAISS